MADTEKELLISPVVGENIIHNTKARLSLPDSLLEKKKRWEESEKKNAPR